MKRLALSPLHVGYALGLTCIALILVSLGDNPSELWLSALLAASLAWLSLIDIDRLLLPDPLTLGLGVAGLIVAALDGWSTFLSSAIGALAGYLVFAGVARLFRRVRGVDGLGGGDAKLLAAGGAWLGWTALPAIVFTASCLGLLWAVLGRAKTLDWDAGARLPFGPFLAIAIWAAWCIIPPT